MRALLGLLLATAVGPWTAQAQDVEAGEAQMLRRINALRRSEDLPPLQRHEGLDAAARRHSEDMAGTGELAHVSPRTGDPAARVREAGVQGVGTVAQNIARDETLIEAHRAIVGSAPHRAQLLDARMTHIGIGSVRGPDGIYVTQVLAQIAEEPAQEPAAVVPALPPPAAAPPVEPEPVAPEPPIGANIPTLPPPGPQPSGAAPMPPTAGTPPAPGAMPPGSPPEPGAPRAQTPTAPGTPSEPIAVPQSNGEVSGYWVFHGNRWWYYRVPPGAPPGTRLSPDPSVVGPPPGYLPNGQRATQGYPGVQSYPQYPPPYAPPPPPPRRRWGWRW